MKAQAIRPTFNLVQEISKTELTQEKLSDNELALAHLANTNGWAVFTHEATELLAILEEANKEAMAKGLDFAEIGKNAVVIGMVKDLVEKLLNKVTDAKEAVEKNAK